MENNQENMETTFVKTKNIKLFHLHTGFEAIEDEINEYCFLIKLETGKQPKIVYTQNYIAVEYIQEEEIQYPIDEDDNF